MSITTHPAAWPAPSVVPVAFPSPLVTAQAALRQARLLKAHLALLEDLVRGDPSLTGGCVPSEVYDLHSSSIWLVEGLERVIGELKS